MLASLDPSVATLMCSELAATIGRAWILHPPPPHGVAQGVGAIQFELLGRPCKIDFCAIVGLRGSPVVPMEERIWVVACLRTLEGPLVEADAVDSERFFVGGTQAGQAVEIFWKCDVEPMLGRFEGDPFFVALRERQDFRSAIAAKSTSTTLSRL